MSEEHNPHNSSEVNDTSKNRINEQSNQVEGLLRQISEFKEKNTDLNHKLEKLLSRNRILVRRLDWVFKSFSIKRQLELFFASIKSKNIFPSAEQFMVVITIGLMIISYFELNILRNQTSILKNQSEKLDKQNTLFENQNKLVENQNQLVISQNLLSEAERRSAYVTMMGTIFESINQEMSNPYNTNRELSPTLLGQIIALSNVLTPYQFMINGKIVDKSYSPERGMLLAFLLDSWLSSNQLNQIISYGNFQNLFVEQLLFYSDTIESINLSGSHIGEIKLNKSRINYFACINCRYKILDITEGQYANISLLDSTGFSDIYINGAHIIDALFVSDTLNKILVVNSNLSRNVFGAHRASTWTYFDSFLDNCHLASDTLWELNFDKNIITGLTSLNVVNSFYFQDNKHYEYSRFLSADSSFINSLFCFNNVSDSIFTIGGLNYFTSFGSILKSFFYEDNLYPELDIDNSVIDAKFLGNYNIADLPCIESTNSREYMLINSNTNSKESIKLLMNMNKVRKQKRDWRSKQNVINRFHANIVNIEGELEFNFYMAY